MELELTQKQKQTLSPQMIQSIEVLQMTAQELLEYLDTALLENPVLDLQEHCDPPSQADDLLRRLEWLDSNDPQNRDYHRQDSEGDTDPLRGRIAAEQEGESLFRHLLAQLNAMRLDEQTILCARLLAASLDGNGWLEEDLSALAAEMGQSAETLESALAVVQSLEPAGVGARSLSECLCLQLRRQQPEDPLALHIAEHYLDALAQGRYALIARELKTDQQEVRRACEAIRGLNPRPGAAFASPERTLYIIPDILVSEVCGRLVLEVNDRFFPTLSISPYYTRILRESGDEQVRDYLAGKLRQAQWMMRAVDQRRSTLTACAQCILELQEDFFRQGPGHLKPMSLADVARQVGVHESTVSRAVNGKYLQCAKGTYPLSFFFSRRVSAKSGAGSVSPDRAKALLRRLIDQEDKCAPLSDQKLCLLMGQEGCVLSRRTVAKYRDELGIPGQSKRKQPT